jgi:iron complex outermembrane receptor protein
LALVAFLFVFASGLHAQQAGSTINGTILYVQGKAVADAQVSIKNEASGAVATAKTNASGYYSVEGLPAGKYTVEATASGFAEGTKKGIEAVDGQTEQVGLSLVINSLTTQITVNAGIDSVAAETAPSGGFVEQRSAQSVISNNYVRNYVSPIADYGEIVQIVPGTFTTSSDGVGLGQSKTYFRGFQDGDYDIDFDGVPFYDTNSPTHHSWAFFPSQWIGGVDFDRSPGTASTIGPTPFGGSIHLLSMPLPTEQNVRATFSYGTWNTKLYDGAFNSGSFGLFGGAKKSNLFVDVHHMSSDGYQTFNYNTRDAGSLLYQYQFSPKTVLTGFSGVIQLQANTYGLNPTRCQTLGAPTGAAYSCAATITYKNVTYNTTPSGILPYSGAGVRFMMTNNSDPANWLDYQYNHYHVPTDFEYVGLKTEFGHGWYMEVKPYTYNYDNAELFTNATAITEVTQAAGIANPSLVPGSVVAPNSTGVSTLYYGGAAVAPCNVQVVKKTVSAEPCGVDKYNSYRKYGETSVLTQTSRFGVFRGGVWYEWARTSRHQYPSDPLTNWTDQPLANFDETFWTNSYQPFAEYEFHVTPKLNITPGTKFAAYTFDIVHRADNGKTVGNLCPLGQTTGCPTTATDTGTFTKWLPSIDANFRIHPNWSVYGQVATGSIVPPSNVYDFNHTPSAAVPTPGLLTPPKQQGSTTYQTGTVLKLQRATLDADYYHIRFQNTYSGVVDPTTSETVYYLQPSSISQGFEAESNIVAFHGFGIYLNGTVGTAYYSGSLNAGTATSPYPEQAPSGLWVAYSPSDTEAQGITYTSKGLDLGFFNKRIGSQRMDNGAYHNQAVVDPFSTQNAYIDYTVQSHTIFNQTKIQLVSNNLLNLHNMQSVGLTGTPLTENIPGTTLTDLFRTTGPSPLAGADTPSFMAGRSFSVTVTFGLSPRERK